MTNQAQDWVSLLLAGLGISFAPHEFLGGMFLALAVASLLARHRKDPRKIWAALGTAALAAILAAVCWDMGGWDFVPVQLVMAAAGVLGRPAATVLVALQDRLEQRSTELADRAIDRVLPDDENGNGGGGVY
ncbi:hypothetical protein [Phaeobacter gallaeciensis]|uniref:hypothetical protein n=1 Tax=Phaeobacter gallaeciensis TaxID=60890 RepID=UPI00237F799D|nr:hypothetical protein [Phaeobacter gallaeciensis]MDE4059781.1 hypothetical protein [Phaeobacter gallaeciensis]MDE4122582.1 hypothetical protein [Phaeobacter gallaeciensis]MDE4127269.1 hypothetical protein [Phaeobacter gallaeciensis]